MLGVLQPQAAFPYPGDILLPCGGGDCWPGEPAERRAACQCPRPHREGVRGLAGGQGPRGGLWLQVGLQLLLFHSVLTNSYHRQTLLKERPAVTNFDLRGNIDA